MMSMSLSSAHKYSFTEHRDKDRTCVVQALQAQADSSIGELSYMHCMGIQLAHVLRMGSADTVEGGQALGGQGQGHRMVHLLDGSRNIAIALDLPPPSPVDSAAAATTLYTGSWLFCEGIRLKNVSTATGEAVTGGAGRGEGTTAAGVQLASCYGPFHRGRWALIPAATASSS
jgi:hypothetical protein